MMTTNEYQTQANNLLAAFGVTFTVTLLGIDCPTFCEDREASRHMDQVGTYPRKSHIHGKHYAVSFTRACNEVDGRNRASLMRVTFDFWNSYHDEEFNFLRQLQIFQMDSYHNLIVSHGFKSGKVITQGKRPPARVPTAYDVIAAIQKYHPGTHKDFCSDFGYDADSRKGFDIYQAVLGEWEKVRSFFNLDEIGQLQEVA